MTGPLTELPRQTVRLRRSSDGIELCFPPFRTPGTALALGVFGFIASAIPTIGLAALLPRALADSAGLMSAVLMATFILPFLAFGLTLIVLAAYMASNALLVRVDPQAIHTWRILFGVTLKRRQMLRTEIRAIEPQISARDQNPFSAEPVYRLIAHGRTRARRVIIAESLKGEALMHEVKALLDHELGDLSDGKE